MVEWKIISRIENLYSITKNKKLIDTLKKEREARLNRKKKTRYEEYHKLAVSPESAIKFLFQNNQNQKIFSELEAHLEHFINVRKNQEVPCFRSPYLVSWGVPKSIGRFEFSLAYLSQCKTVVETGIANGISSSYILLALNELKNGKLISIDSVFRPWQSEEAIGKAIPDYLQKYHEIIILNSDTDFKNILKDLKFIDIFIHDSLHTYSHMMGEYTIAWPYINKGGFLTSDDVGLNDAFLDFANKVKRTPIIISKGNNLGHYGLIKK